MKLQRGESINSNERPSPPIFLAESISRRRSRDASTLASGLSCGEA
jgi:hypothetical protein